MKKPLFIVSILVLVVFFIYTFVYAAPLYKQGQTLNPSCSPDNLDCTVDISIGNQEILYSKPIYSQNIQWEHDRGTDEITGSNTYKLNSHNIYGMYEYISKDININAVEANVWNRNLNSDVIMKIYIRGNLSNFNPNTISPDYSMVINHNNMPHKSNTGGFRFNLSNQVNVLKGQYLFIIWEAPNTNELSVGMFNSNSSSTPYRHNFLLGTTGSSLIGTNLPLYSSATFKLYGNTDITANFVDQLGSELILNPGFELLGGPNIFSSWSNDAGNGTHGKEDATSTVYSGSHAIKLSYLGGAWFTSQLAQKINVIPGEKYRLSFWTRGDGINAGKYALYDISHSSYIEGTETGITTGVVGNQYKEVIVDFIVPNGSTIIKLFLLSPGVEGSYAYFDDVSIKKITTLRVPISVSLETILNNLALPDSVNISFSDPTSKMISKNVQDAILEAYNKISTSTNGVSGNNIPRLILPDTIYAVVGDKLQLFFRGIIEAQNPYNLPYIVNSSVGNSYPRYFEFTPTLSDLGDKSFTIKVLDYDYTPLISKTINIKVSNPDKQPDFPKNILIVGDSLTAAGVWQTELYRRLTQSGGSPSGLGFQNINFIGDKVLPGYSQQAYVGFGGWSYPLYIGTSGENRGHVLEGSFDKDKSDVGSTWRDSNGGIWTIVYAINGLKVFGTGTLPSSGTLTHVSGASHTDDIVYSSSNTEPQTPFWDTQNNKFSISSWAQRNGYSDIDAAYILLGWNSVGTPNKTDYSSYIDQVKTFLDQLHTDFPNVIVRIIGIQVPSVNGGLGNNYGASGGLSEYYGTLKSANNMNIAYQNLANDPTYSSWVKFISPASQFDSEYNMPQALTPVNSRSNITEYRGTNGVHPSDSGYYQIADSVYREFVNTFLSN